MTTQPGRTRTALARVGIAFGAGVVVAVVAMLLGFWYVAAQLAWDALALTYIGLTLPAVLRLDARDTARKAAEEDPTNPVADLLLLAASVASLAAVTVVLVRASDSSGVAQVLLIVLSVVSVVVSWALVHVTYLLRYAKLYYSDPVGGVDFHTDDGEDPTYVDFAYLAFTIGMTFQVSDTELTRRTIRRAALRHALLSYLFGTVILATTINLVAGLAR